ncbi:hypothetical protein G3N59_10580 [Paraburkholderia sp. Ac-20340]|uniref:hypothetical protein n=1 Tax=Paraburkholderia sp. Ac-20340 TaxID=2703888 RepID=UPI0019805EB0|nr:hypothetical protein [Paraburkholderia sp. Ac-20340]MBN3853826.1 hypothetical protein [Paraburkholderia sp. Ac-20340]
MRIKLLSLLMAAAFPMRMADDAPAAAPVDEGNAAGGVSSVEQPTGETPAAVVPDLSAAGEPGNDSASAPAAPADASVAPIVGGEADAPEVAPESGEGSASPAAVESASGTLSSASNALPGDVIPAANASGALDDGDASAPDHKSILETLLGDLEGIVHMAKSEIIAVIDRAKALL